MSQRSDDANPFDPFGTMRSMRDANMEAWSKMMQQFVNTEEYSKATSSMLDAYLTTSAPFRKALEQAMTQVLQQFNMPTRMDVTNLAERLTNIETRLDDPDAQLTALQRGGSAGGGQGQARGQRSASDAAASIDPVVGQLSETDTYQTQGGNPQSEEHP